MSEGDTGSVGGDRKPLAVYDVVRIEFEYDDQPGVFKERPVIVGATRG